MNKTFEINKKNNESYSFSESLNTPIFPQIFKNFEIEKVKYEDELYNELSKNNTKIVLPKYKNIKKN